MKKLLVLLNFLAFTPVPASAYERCMVERETACFLPLITRMTRDLAEYDADTRSNLMREIGSYGQYTPYDPAIGEAILEGIEDVPLDVDGGRYKGALRRFRMDFDPQWEGMSPAVFDLDDPYARSAAVYTGLRAHVLRRDWDTATDIVERAQANDIDIDFLTTRIAIATVARQDDWTLAGRIASDWVPRYQQDAFYVLALEAYHREAWDQMAMALNRMHDAPPAEGSYPSDLIEQKVRLALGGFVLEGRGGTLAYDPEVVFDDVLAYFQDGASPRDPVQISREIADYHAMGFPDRARQLQDARGFARGYLTDTVRAAGRLLHDGHAEVAHAVLQPALPTLHARLEDLPTAEEFEAGGQRSASLFDFTYPELVTFAIKVLSTTDHEEEKQALATRFAAFQDGMDAIRTPDDRVLRTRKIMENELALDLGSLDDALAIWERNRPYSTRFVTALARAGHHDVLLDVVLGRALIGLDKWREYAALIPDDAERKAFLTTVVDSVDEQFGREPPLMRALIGGGLAVTAATADDWPRAKDYLDETNYNAIQLKALIDLATMLSDDIRKPVRHAASFMQPPVP